MPILESLSSLLGRRAGQRVVETVKEKDTVEDQTPQIQRITEVVEDNRQSDILSGRISSIIESGFNTSTVGYSPTKLSQMIMDDGVNAGQLLSNLRSDFTLREIYQENEEMSKDSVIGAVMEIIADDICQVDERRGLIVTVESEDEKLQRFLQDFLTNNVGIEDRIWTWTYEITKHGDFKLRRREFYTGSQNSKIKSVYYEDVVNPYLVSRIEYMGNVLGYEDEDYDDVTNTNVQGDYGFSDGMGQAKFERSDSFVHFISSKLSRREKIRLSVKNDKNEMEVVTCYKVVGTSIVDNVRYIFRVINMLDNMLILSRVARSTQYNLVKVDVGNASASKTQEILMDVRRRIEGSTRMRKNVGMKTDPSPIPVNSNVYIPTREGRGDVTIESVGENVDVRGLMDIDYFKNKEFAALKVPQQYLGFEESLGSFGNNSLARMDLRYARSVQRVQTILMNGIKALCNNYLAYRGRIDDINKFRIWMRPIVTQDMAGRVEEFVANAQALDSFASTLDQYAEYIDKAKAFKMLLGLVGISPVEIASNNFLNILKEMSDGTYDEANHVPAEDEMEDEAF